MNIVSLSKRQILAVSNRKTLIYPAPTNQNNWASHICTNKATLTT